LEVLGYLFLPFIFYPIWGIFACYFVAKIISARVIGKYGVTGANVAATIVLLIFFTPFLVLSEGGNIPVVFPLIAIYLGYITNPLLEAPIGQVASFFVTFLFIPVSVLVSMFATSRVRRQAAKLEQKD